MTRDIPWYLKPVMLLWKLARAVVPVLGTTWSIILGVLLFLIGMSFSVTIIGSLIGIPMMVFGVMLVISSLR